MTTDTSSRLAEDMGWDVEEEPEVLVVGAGPVGLFAALLLARQGHRVMIVDEERRPAARSYALALHPLTLHLLAEAGLDEAVLGRGHRIESMAFYDGRRRRASLDFTALHGQYPMVLVLPQQSLEGILASQLEEEGVEILWGHRVTDLHGQEGRTLSRIERVHGGLAGGEAFSVLTSFVLGADGHRSFVRRALGIDFAETASPELYAVFEFAGGGHALHEVRVALGEGTADVLWPVGEGRFRWSFQIHERDWEGFVEPRFKSRTYAPVEEEPFPYLVQEKLGELIAQRAPWFDLPVGSIVWSMAARFERRLADRFGRGNVWLAGDAAHLAGPIGAQSMNIGLREAHELSWRISRVLQDEAPPASLDLYERERRREWRELQGLEGEPLAEARADDWIVRNASRLVSCIPASGESLEALLRQIGLELEPDEDREEI